MDQLVKGWFDVSKEQVVHCMLGSRIARDIGF